MSISTQNSGDTGEQTKRGQIITFYSYKGGTGRSMALANTACILAERLAGNESNGILMVDWDLEAPGLHRYFRRKFLASKAIDEGSGLIDLFYDLDRKVDLYIEGNRDNSQSLATEQAARDVVKQIDLSRYVLPTTIPNLSLLKVGCLDLYINFCRASHHFFLPKILCNHFQYIMQFLFHCAIIEVELLKLFARQQANWLY